MSAAEPQDEVRLYGNWRAERGWGIGALSTSATVTVFVSLLVPLLAVSIAPVAALPLAAVAAIAIAAVVVRIGGSIRYSRASIASWLAQSEVQPNSHPPLQPHDPTSPRGVKSEGGR